MFIFFINRCIVQNNREQPSQSLDTLLLERGAKNTILHGFVYLFVLYKKYIEGHIYAETSNNFQNFQC